MKLKTFSRQLCLINLIIIAFANRLPVMACGPYSPIIPTPRFFTSTFEGKTMEDINEEENLRLWQQLTSERIPLKDIEEVVYGNSIEISYSLMNSASSTGNQFCNFLKNTKDMEIIDFLYNAKKLEVERARRNSPWFYPSSRDGDEYSGIRYLIEVFDNYRGKRLRDRYSLQMVRALFASCQYERCVEYYDSAFIDIPETNLFRRMAMDYVAGCWAHLGDYDNANRYFAKTGRLYSLNTDDNISYLSDVNPDAIELLKYLQECSDDSARLCSLKPVAEKVLRKGIVRNRGDWEFLLAYIAGEYHNDYRAAGRHISKGLCSSFSSEDLRNHAVAYRIKCDAANGVSSTLLSDLKWFEGKIDALASDAVEWNRMLQNIVYLHWVPALWKKKDYAMAILLCGYADNLLRSSQRYEQLLINEPRDVIFFTPYSNMSLSEMRDSEKNRNLCDYGCLSFQLMGSLKSSQLIDVYRRSANTPIRRYLKEHARMDKDYIYEIIGTLAIREENYDRAMRYLSQVSDKYLRTMNIYKGGYVKRDPFIAYPCRWEKYMSDPEWTYEYNRSCGRMDGPCNAKFMFASRMYRYKQKMRNGRTCDERALARLMYAIGRRNSFEECWALTQYWRGVVTDMFFPSYNIGRII